MPSSKITRYICSECGYTTTTKTGKCPSCNSWGTFETLQEATNALQSQNTAPCAKIISALDVKAPSRIATGIGEFDRVLGGGLVPGGVVLIGGQPGIGKSTLLLQAAGSVAKNNNASVLYVSGEESDAQVALRASRINVATEKLYLYSGSNLEDALRNIDDNWQRLRLAWNGNAGTCCCAKGSGVCSGTQYPRRNDWTYH